MCSSYGQHELWQRPPGELGEGHGPDEQGQARHRTKIKLPLSKIGSSPAGFGQGTADKVTGPGVPATPRSRAVLGIRRIREVPSIRHGTRYITSADPSVD